MAYVDGYLIPVSEDKREDYCRLAALSAPIFLDHGALQVVENWGDDLPHGKTTDFFMAVKAEQGETIVFSWITWPDKETRDKGNKAAMADPRFQPGSGPGTPGDIPMPFDGKRMIFGGFTTIVDAKG